MATASTSPAPASESVSAAVVSGGRTAVTVLAAVSFAHFLNDSLQSLLPALYPMLKPAFGLSFSEIGLLTFTYQVVASLLQPIVGYFSDKQQRFYLLACGMTLTLVGLALISVSKEFWMLMGAAILLGSGSSIFHPEASRIARLASGGRHGLAQSVFQVGGNFGQAIGPLLAALLIMPHGQGTVAWFTIAALVGIVLLWNVGLWYGRHKNDAMPKSRRSRGGGVAPALSKGRVNMALGILLLLIFSKYFYLAGLSNYFTFYLIAKFGLTTQAATIRLFIFAFAVAAGTVIGGPIGDRFGRKYVMWFSILGALPFTLILPYANLFWTSALSVVIGLIIASAFSAILVYAQELLPGRVGMVSGFFFGFAFGMGAIGAAVLGVFADHFGIEFVYRVCSVLPVIGALAAFLPNLDERVGPVSAAAPAAAE